jgi:photosystem II stability/assembly factor-like uncharacterized protein
MSHARSAVLVAALASCLAACDVVPDLSGPAPHDPYACPSRTAPTRLDARPISSRWVALSWNNADPICDGRYRVERRGSQGAWEERATVTGLSAIDEAGIPGHARQYRVAARSGGGYSPIATATTFESEHWLPAADAPRVTMLDLQFVDGRAGYACGARGTLLRTIDAGATWAPVASPDAPTGDLTGLAFADSALGIVVGAEGLWVTRDGCRSWTHTLEAERLQGCAFASRRTAVAIGENMRFHRTTDAGENWIAGELGGPWTLLSIAFADSAHGWIATHGLYETTDGGASWTAMDLPGSSVEWFSGLALSSAGTLLAVHRQGVARIAGGVLSWPALDLAADGGLAVAWAAPGIAFAGSRLGFYRSGDDGQSWQPVSWPLLSPNAVAFADPLVGVAVGEPHDPADSPILRTIDGGGR